MRVTDPGPGKASEVAAVGVIAINEQRRITRTDNGLLISSSSMETLSAARR